MDYKGEVLVAGEYTHDREFMKEMERKPFYPRVKMIGYIADKSLLLALVRRARLFVFPSLSEGMSIMLLEATSTGAPWFAAILPPTPMCMTKQRCSFSGAGMRAIWQNSLDGPWTIRTRWLSAQKGPEQGKDRIFG